MDAACVYSAFGAPSAAATKSLVRFLTAPASRPAGTAALLDCVDRALAADKHASVAPLLAIAATAATAGGVLAPVLEVRAPARRAPPAALPAVQRLKSRRSIKSPPSLPPSPPPLTPPRRARAPRSTSCRGWT